MRNIFVAVLVMAVASPMTGVAQFVPTLGSDVPRVCPQQPGEPNWIEDIDIREAHKGNLVQMMYRAQGMQAVSESGDCSCESRFPSWDAAQKHYYEHYADLERWEVLEKIDEYRRIASGHRKVAKPLCEQQGNW